MDTSTFLQELHPKNLNNHKTVLNNDTRRKSSSSSVSSISSIPSLNTTTIHIKQQQQRQRNECNFFVNENKKQLSNLRENYQNHHHHQSNHCTNANKTTIEAMKKTIINEEKCKMLNSNLRSVSNVSNGSERTVANETFSMRPTLFPTLKSSDTDQHHLNHVLNIKISPTDGATFASNRNSFNRNGAISEIYNNKISVIQVNQNQERNLNNLKQFCVNMMVQNNDFDSEVNNNQSKKLNKDLKMSGQCSPTTSDHLDSGTCSDAELNIQSSSPTPAPLPKKLLMKHNLLSDSMCSNSDDSVSSISSDSLTFQNNNLLSPELIKSLDNHKKKQQQLILEDQDQDQVDSQASSGLFPSSLLKDIRTHSLKLVGNHITSSRSTDDDEDEDEDCPDVLDYEPDDFEVESNYSECTTLLKSPMLVNQVSNYEQNIKYNNENNRKSSNNESNLISNVFYENDKFYKFHINEHLSSALTETNLKDVDESFAGLKDFNNGTSTIRSSKGTVRGVKNRVRNGIATFLQMQHSTIKNFKEKDAGKVIVYTTSISIVRSTYTKCQNVKQILKTLLVKFEERDVFMSLEYQQEIKDRMQKDEVDVPQLFVNGQHIGDAEKVERLNETGELRKMLKPYQNFESVITCKTCGGYKLLPCPSCGGSKKSVHRNHFTAEFIALKCMNCDEVGLVKCYTCT